MTKDVPTRIAEPAYEGQWDTAAAFAGAKAFHAGKPLKSCPHEPSSRARVDWRRGWLKENEKADK